MSKATRRYVELKAKKQSLEEELRVVKEEMSHLVTALHEEYRVIGVKSLVLDSGERVTTVTTPRARISPGCSVDQVLQLAAETGLNLSLNANSLTSWVKERTEQGEEVPDNVDVYEQRTISVTKGR